MCKMIIDNSAFLFNQREKSLNCFAVSGYFALYWERLLTSSAINHTPAAILRDKKEAEPLVKTVHSLSFVEHSDLINYLLPGDVLQRAVLPAMVMPVWHMLKWKSFLSQRVKKVGTVPSRLEPRAVYHLYSCQASHRGYKVKVYHLTKFFIY